MVQMHGMLQELRAPKARIKRKSGFQLVGRVMQECLLAVIAGTLLQNDVFLTNHPTLIPCERVILRRNLEAILLRSELGSSIGRELNHVSPVSERHAGDHSARGS